MSRPCDWWPLCERDPLRGEAEEMAVEAVRLRNVGVEMRAQIGRLRGIETDPGSVGEHADALRVAAGKLAGPGREPQETLSSPPMPKW